MADNHINDARPVEVPASQKTRQGPWLKQALILRSGFALIRHFVRCLFAPNLASSLWGTLQRRWLALILICGVVTFMGGAALIIKGTFYKQSEALSDNKAHVYEEEKRIKEYLEKEEKQYYLEFPFFRIPLLSIPIIQNDALVGTLNIKLEIEAADKSAFDMSRIVLPIIVDRIFCDLYAIFGALWIPSLDPKMESIKTHVKRAIRKIVGSHKIKNVYIRQFYIERKIIF